MGTQIGCPQRLYQTLGIHDLVYAEFHETMLLAIAREKQIKKWRRAWKIRLIEESSPEWRDLYKEVTGS
jgi:putative endonuclease